MMATLKNRRVIQCSMKRLSTWSGDEFRADLATGRESTGVALAWGTLCARCYALRAVPSFDTFLAAKALHIVGFVSWFAGLFYIVRLFIYHAEAGERPPTERDVLQPQLELMAARLWKIITMPAAILTLGAGVYMSWFKAVSEGGLPGWLHLKYALLVGLYAYHFTCGAIRRRQAAHTSTWTSRHLRVWNELATMFMVAIVFLAVFKRIDSVPWAVGGLLALGISLMLGIRVYRRMTDKATPPPPSVAPGSDDPSSPGSSVADPSAAQ